MSSVHDNLFFVSGAPLLREHFGVSVTYDGSTVLKAAVGAEVTVDDDDSSANRRTYRRTITVYRTATTPAGFYPTKKVLVDLVEYTIYEVVSDSDHAVTLDIRRRAVTEVHGGKYRGQR